MKNLGRASSRLPGAVLGQGSRLALVIALVGGAIVAASPATAQEAPVSPQGAQTQDPNRPGVHPAPVQAEATPPAATDASADSDNKAAEIIVTAQFRAQRLQNTPVAITAVTGDLLRERGNQSITDLSNSAPNVTLNKGTGIYSGAQAFIRGVGQFDFLPAKEPGVGMYLDDVYYGNLFGADFNLLDLDRVEILRGPQGTLAGANSIGGAIKIYSRKPGETSDAYFEAGYGSNQKVLARGAFNVTIVPDTLFLRVTGGIDRDSGYVKIVDFACAYPSEAGTLPKTSSVPGDCVTGKAGGQNSTAARAALRWVPNDRLEVNLSADINLVDNGPDPSHLYAVNQDGIDHPANPPSYNDPTWLNLTTTPPSIVPGIPASYGIKFDDRFIPTQHYVTYSTYRDMESHQQTPNPNGYMNSYGGIGTIDYKLSDDFSFKSITAYRQTDARIVEDQDGSPLNLSSPAVYQFTHKQWTEEDRISGKLLDGLIDATIGGFYYNEHDHLTGLVDVPGVFIPFGGLLFAVDDHIKSTKAAGYATATIHPTPKLNITGGYRYTSSKKSYQFGRYDPDPPSLVTLFDLGALNTTPPAVAKTKRSDYRVAVDYQWTPTFMTYASWATGFKDAGVNPTPTTPAQVYPFKAETLNSYEAGFKSDFFDRRVRLNVTAFVSKYQDLQLKSLGLDSTGALISLNSNAGKATIKGLEVESELHPVTGLLLTGSFSYLDFKYNDLGKAGDPANGPSRPCITCTNIYTPKYQFNASAQYQIDLGDTGTLTPRIDANYRSHMFADLSNNPAEEIAGRWVANARLTWRAPTRDWEVALAASNLFNKYYYNSLNDYYYAQGTAVAAPARPREIMLSVRRNF